MPMDASDSLKIGDTVRLNCGGQIMVVAGIGGRGKIPKGSVCCQWNTKSGSPQEKIYQIACLERAEKAVQVGAVLGALADLTD